MSTDLKELQRNDFWIKKIRRVAEVADVAKNGFIERKDFEIIIQRYKDIAKASAERNELLAKSVMKLCDVMGCTDDTMKLTYSEFVEKYAAMIVKMQEFGTEVDENTFKTIDLNGDGHISLEEWTTHYKCMGIDTAHAPASFDALDQNKDGEISLDEFVAFHNEYFHSSDNTLNSAILFGPLQ